MQSYFPNSLVVFDADCPDCHLCSLFAYLNRAENLHDVRKAPRYYQESNNGMIVFNTGYQIRKKEETKDKHVKSLSRLWLSIYFNCCFVHRFIFLRISCTFLYISYSSYYPGFVIMRSSDLALSFLSYLSTYVYFTTNGFSSSFYYIYFSTRLLFIYSLKCLIYSSFLDISLSSSSIYSYSDKRVSSFSSILF